jgi:hypothetical protein
MTNDKHAGARALLTAVAVTATLIGWVVVAQPHGAPSTVTSIDTSFVEPVQSIVDTITGASP